jgi:membrane protein YqaA with SNARE-associated domain
VPTDIILTPLVLLHRKKWLHYGLVATLTSVAGGVTAYFLGKFFFTTFGEQLFSVYALQDDFLHVQRLFDRNTFIAMLISAFTFIPYKVFAIAGGVFHINLASFIGASLLGRSLRFVAESYVMYRFGPVIGRVVYRYFSIIVGLLIVLAGIAVFFLVS